MAKIVLLPGDGIGPEIIAEVVKVLEAVAQVEDVEFQWETADMGGIAIDKYGTPLPEATVAACRRADGVLLGAVGGPKWDDLPGDLRPEAGLLGIRRELGLFANLRSPGFRPLGGGIHPQGRGSSRYRYSSCQGTHRWFVFWSPPV